MDAKLRSLWWKEWREQRWKLAFGVVILGALTAVGLRARIIPDIGIIFCGMILGAFALPLLVAMGLVAGERAEGSFGTLLALPERPWRILAVKLSVAVLTVLAPLALALLIVLIMAGGRELNARQIGTIYLTIGWIGLNFLFWVLAFAIAQPTEARVGLVALGVGTLWLIWVLAANSLQTMFATQREWLRFLFWRTHPFWCIDRTADGSQSFEIPFLQYVVLVFILSWIFYRFARLARRAR